MIKSLSLLSIIIILTFNMLPAQCYWQQEVAYEMEVDLDVEKHLMKGEQQIVYTNHSPDILGKVFYHLYFNAFQPNSMMDVRSRTVADADPRISDRIKDLDDSEIGYHDIIWLRQDGREVEFQVQGTILEAKLPFPLQPGQSTVLTMKFKSQVPVQIRRSGRDNEEGISYSMSQWYPKLCEYDEYGWHPNPYVGKEYYGVWGDFDVKITTDQDYMVAAGGVLMNDPRVQKGRKKTWHYRAENVHDFMWAADPDYTHDTFLREDGTEMHFYYQPGERTTDNWKELPSIMDVAFGFINQHYGQYPYPVYAFVQGGDGGMEYPMGTLITGERSLISLVGVSVHELMHSWYQMMMGTNESLYAWMDEGFTVYATNHVMNHLKKEGLLPGFEPLEDPMASSMTGYRNFSKTPIEEALITHADHFQRNQAYGVAAYVKGAVFVHQLSYVIGQSTLEAVLLDYYNQWKFKHPDADDFIRVAERNSDMVLDWYKEYWINSTHTIDYAIDTVQMGSKRKRTVIRLSRQGKMPMPVDVVVTDEKGETTTYHIPLRMMRGAKSDEGLTDHFIVAEDWPWTHLTYDLDIPMSLSDIRVVEIDPSNRMADIDLTNNRKELDRDMQ